MRLAVGVLVLLFAALLPVRYSTGRHKAILGIVLGLIASLAIVHLVLHLEDFVLDSDDEAVIKMQVDKVRAALTTGHLPKNLVIVEGSSATAQGLDGIAVQTLLRQRGYDVLVLQFSLQAANHLERYSMLRRFTEEMRRIDFSYCPNTELMLEIHQGYDVDPLAQFAWNLDSVRDYYYASFSNLLFALRTTRLLRAQDRESGLVFGEFASHLLARDLNIGLLLEMRSFADISGQPAFGPSFTPERNFSFKPTDLHQIELAANGDVDMPEAAIVAREQRITALFEGKLAGTAYFSMPAADLGNMTYAHAFCLRHGSRVCIDPADPSFYPSIDQARYFWNHGHLLYAGAELYARFFADQLVAKGVVIK